MIESTVAYLVHRTSLSTVINVLYSRQEIRLSNLRRIPAKVIAEIPGAGPYKFQAKSTLLRAIEPGNGIPQNIH